MSKTSEKPILPPNFLDYSETRKNGFLRVMDLKESGKRVAGIFCTFTPLEILDAAGFTAVSLCGMSDETIKDAEKLQTNVLILIFQILLSARLLAMARRKCMRKWVSTKKFIYFICHKGMLHMLLKCGIRSLCASKNILKASLVLR